MGSDTTHSNNFKIVDYSEDSSDTIPFPYPLSSIFIYKNTHKKTTILFFPEQCNFIQHLRLPSEVYFSNTPVYGVYYFEERNRTKAIETEIFSTF